MGQALNKLFSLTLREVKMYNLERRTEKIISKDKPTPAPMLPTTVKELERLKEENVSTEYLHKKDEQLDEFLKKVYVSSPDLAPPLEREINPGRPLPLKRTTDLGITYGYSESEEAAVPEGRVSLKQALAFVSNHQNDPKKYSSAAIASEYKLSPTVANDILEHFKMFDVKVNKKKVDPATLTTYERLQFKIKHMNIYNASEIMKELKSVYGGDIGKEKSVVAKMLDEESPPDGNVEKAKESRKSGTRMGQAQEKKELEKEENLEKEDVRLKPGDDVKKGYARKKSQENG